MQRVTNCVLLDQTRDEVLLLQKPRRGWWVAPGGKMEPGETILEAVRREFREETGIFLVDPVLKGVFTMVIEQDGQPVDEWMLFTFLCHRYEGELIPSSPEGTLAWMPRKQVMQLPQAEGDRLFFHHLLNHDDPPLIIHRFRYTPDYQLIGYE